MNTCGADAPRAAAYLLKPARVLTDVPFQNQEETMGSPMNSLAICAYTLVREQCDAILTLFELFRRGVPDRRTWT
jgi:hypothetical protein